MSARGPLGRGDQPPARPLPPDGEAGTAGRVEDGAPGRRLSESSSLARVEELFHELVDLAPEARARRLIEVAAEEDAETVASLRRLLARADSGRDLSEMGAVAVPLDTLDAAGELAGGGELGPYRLLRELGRGGMGVVYEAEQLEPVRRRVALKLVASPFAGGQVLERFEAERQTLARMTHPGIAQVYDAGETPGGRPFVVMELVEGEPITDFCDRRELDPETRIRLFLEVCSAAQHAHQKGIIHRDLKPSNVLAREVDGRPQAKVIDFGIAKAIARDDSDGGVTRAGEILGTPDYMSPEQREHGAAEVDTRTDVYALGVLLYELLTGRLPHSRGAARAEETPSRPSVRAEERCGDTDAIAQRRGTTPAALGRLLRGDLDWIALRALAPNREQRYPSVSALADDLERFLRHEPVSAGPPGIGYRVRKLVRRHRAAVAAAAVAICALVAGTVGATIGLLRARAAEQEARLEASTAERVTDFLVDLFQVSDPTEADGREITVSEVLSKGAARVRDELAEEPEVQARLLRTIGVVYSSLGLYRDAQALLEQAVALQRGPADDPAELANSLVELGRVHRRLDALDAAEAAAREAVAIRQSLEGVSPQAIGSALNELALIVRPRDPEEALDHYRDSLRHLDEAGDEAGGNVGVVLANIGAIEARAGRYEAAREAFERARPLIERHLGADDPRSAGLYGNLAFVYRKLGEHRRAMELAERDLELARRSLGEDHPTLSAIHTNLSALSSRLGEREQALRHAERAVAIAQKLPPGHRLRLVALNAASTAQLRLGDYERSRATIQTLLAELPPGSADREVGATEVRSLIQLSEVERLAGEPHRAAELAERALAHPLSSGDPQIESAAWWTLAHARLALADVAGAEDASQRAILSQESGPGVSPGDRLHARARWHAAAGQVDVARALFEQALAEGYRDAFALEDPVLSAVRAAPGFADLARVLETGS